MREYKMDNLFNKLNNVQAENDLTQSDLQALELISVMHHQLRDMIEHGSVTEEDAKRLVDQSREVYELVVPK